MRRFGWTWVGLLFVDNEVVNKLAQSFQSELAQSGVGCLAYVEVLPFEQQKTVTKLERIVTVMKKSTARVVIAFVLESHMVNLMEEV